MSNFVWERNYLHKKYLHFHFFTAIQKAGIKTGSTHIYCYTIGYESKDTEGDTNEDDIKLKEEIKVFLTRYLVLTLYLFYRIGF